MLNLSELTQYAIQMVDFDQPVLVGGKKVNVAFLLSDTLGLPLVTWLSKSIADRFGNAYALNKTLIVDKEKISGINLKEDDLVAGNNVDTNVLNKSLSVELLIFTEAVEQFLKPARLNPKFDYSELLYEFRETVIKNHDVGDELKVNDFDLHELIHKHLHKPVYNKEQLKNLPSSKI